MMNFLDNIPACDINVGRYCQHNDYISYTFIYYFIWHQSATEFVVLENHLAICFVRFLYVLCHDAAFIFI